MGGRFRKTALEPEQSQRRSFDLRMSRLVAYTQ